MAINFNSNLEFPRCTDNYYYYTTRFVFFFSFHSSFFKNFQLNFWFVCTPDCPVRASWNKRKKKIPIYLLPISLVFFWNILVDDDGKQAFEKEKKRNNWFPGSSLLTLLETNQKVTEENDGREKTGNAAVVSCVYVCGAMLYGFLSLSLYSFFKYTPIFSTPALLSLVRILFFLILFWGFYFRFFSFFFWVELLLLSTILLKEGDTNNKKKKAFDFIIKVFFLNRIERRTDDDGESIKGNGLFWRVPCIVTVGFP